MSFPLSDAAHVLMQCTSCGQERDFEQPTCGDGHASDCPDWACLVCGMAVFVGGAHPQAPMQSLRRSA